MSRKRKRGYRICKTIPVKSLVFLWTWTRTSVVPYELGQTSQRMGSHRQENDTEVWSFTSNILLCWTTFDRRCQVQEGQGDHLPCETAKITKPLLKCHKKQVSQQKLAKATFFVTRLSINEGRWTLACREYTLLRDTPDFKKSLCFVWSCLGYEDNDFGRVTFYWSLGAIRKRIFSWVLISTGLNPHASQILNLEQFVAKEAEGYPSWVNTTLHRAHFTHANIFLRVAEGPEPGSARMVSCVFLKKSHLHPHWSCFTCSQCCLTSRHFHFHNTVHPLYSFPRTVVPTAIHTLEDSLVAWLNKSPLLCYEPNVTVEASSAEVTPMLSPSRRASFGSTYNSREDVTTSLVSSEVDKRQKHVNVGFTAVHAEERGKCSTSKNLSIWQRKFCVTLITQSSHGETCGDVLAQTKIEPRSTKFTGVLFRERERTFAEHREVRDFLGFRADTAAQGEKAALHKLSEAEHHTILLLDEMNVQEWYASRKYRYDPPWIKPTDSFSSRGTLPGESGKWECRERASLAPCRTGEPWKSSPRNSYWNSPRNGRIEKDLLCCGWENSTVENGWTYPTRI